MHICGRKRPCYRRYLYVLKQFSYIYLRFCEWEAVYLLYGVTVKSSSGTCAPISSTSYTPRSLAFVGSRTKISKKFENSCMVTIKGDDPVAVAALKGSLFLCHSN